MARDIVIRHVEADQDFAKQFANALIVVGAELDLKIQYIYYCNQILAGTAIVSAAGAPTDLWITDSYMIQDYNMPRARNYEFVKLYLRGREDEKTPMVILTSQEDNQHTFKVLTDSRLSDFIYKDALSIKETARRVLGNLANIQ